MEDTSSNISPLAHGQGPIGKVANLQKIIYENLMSFYISDLPAIIFKRVQNMFDPHPVYKCSFEFEAASELMRKHLRKFDNMRIIKTWVNSWSTSYRYHETPLLPCVFGCPREKDNQDHYVMCPILFHTLRQLRPTTSPDPIERIGLFHTSVDNLRALSCTFSGYHAVRRSDRLTEHPAPPKPPFRTFASQIFAEAFFTEALEIDLPCRSPASLIREPRVHLMDLADYPEPVVQSPFCRVHGQLIDADSNMPDNSVPTGTAGPLLAGTDPGTLSSRFVAGEDFQWQHVGLATGK
jgi:hypothetical protein